MFIAMASTKRGLGFRSSGKKLNRSAVPPTQTTAEVVARVLSAIRQHTDEEYFELHVGGPTRASPLAKVLRYRQEQWQPENDKEPNRSHLQRPESVWSWLRPRGYDLPPPAGKATSRARKNRTLERKTREAEAREAAYFEQALARAACYADDEAYAHAVGHSASEDSRVLVGTLCEALLPLFKRLNAPRAFLRDLERQVEQAEPLIRASLKREADTKKDAMYRFSIPSVLSFLTHEQVEDELQRQFLECLLVDMPRGTIRNRISKYRVQQRKLNGGRA